MNTLNLSKTIYWHDYETFGSDPRRDRACQFAGIRTDENLNVVGEPLVIYCQPAADCLPQPEACLITGITPQKALAEGVCEAEFIGRIANEFSQPGTCVAGYNSIRFDDEMTRQLLYRNFHDPYEREWKNGNSRWDIIDMLRLCRALRPEGINWPDVVRDREGAVASHIKKVPTFRLESLTAANGIDHGKAHDALADVYATIAMARLIKDKQPKLYNFVYGLRDKRRVAELLDVESHTPVIHVSAMYPASRGCLALVAPLMKHPSDRNGVIAYDLRHDPADWVELSADEIRHRLYTKAVDLAPGAERIPLKVIHCNRCPVVAPTSVLSPEAASRYDIDSAQCGRHLEVLKSTPGLQAKLAEVFTRKETASGSYTANGSSTAEGSGTAEGSYTAEGSDTTPDPDFMIYSGGFFGGPDKLLMQQIRSTAPGDLAGLSPAFTDWRLKEMFFRYRARNYPESLHADDQGRWLLFCRERLESGAADAGSATLNLSQYLQEIERLRQMHSDPAALRILDELEEYASVIRSSWRDLQPVSGTQ